VVVLVGEGGGRERSAQEGVEDKGAGHGTSSNTLGALTSPRISQSLCSLKGMGACSSHHVK